MKTTPRHRKRTTGLMALAAVAIAATLAGCAGSGGDGAPAPGPSSDTGEHLDPLDPAVLSAGEIAVTGMQTILSWQPAVDPSKTAALHRATRWLSPELAATADVPGLPPGTLRPDPDWEAWKTSGDVVTAACTAPALPPEPADTVTVTLTCRQTVLHSSGATTALAPETWVATVVHTGSGWRLHDYRYTTGG